MKQRLRRNTDLILPVLLFLLAGEATFGSSFSHELRLGADYTNQTYSTWVSDTTTSDTAAVETEGKLSWRVLMKPADRPLKLGGTNTLTLSTSSLRDNFSLELKQSLADRLTLESGVDAEVRLYHRLLPAITSASWRRDNLQGSARLGLDWSLSPAAKVGITDRLEMQHYPSPDSYNYDYLLNRIESRYRLEFGILSSLDAGLDWSRRRALTVDSQDYNSYSLRFGLDTYLGEDWQLRVDNDLDRRRYDVPARSCWEESPAVGLFWNPLPKLTLQLNGAADITLYDKPDDVYTSNWVNRPGFTIVWQADHGLSLKLGPRFETCRSVPSVRPEDYRDRALEFGLDLLMAGRLWLSAEDRLGRRTYQSADSSYQSDYRYNEFNGMLDWTIAGALNLSTMVTVSPEWHAEQTDNLAATTFSVELRYGF